MNPISQTSLDTQGRKSDIKQVADAPVQQAQTDDKDSAVNSTETGAKVKTEQVQDVVSRMKAYVQTTERTLDFRVDDNSGQTVISVYDKNSDELIRQIPGELALKLAERLNDEEPSLLFSAQV